LHENRIQSCGFDDSDDCAAETEVMSDKAQDGSAACSAAVNLSLDEYNVNVACHEPCATTTTAAMVASQPELHDINNHQDLTSW